MAVTRRGNSYLVSGKEARQIENYVFKKLDKKEKDKETQKEKAIWDKSLQKRKAILAC